MTALFFAILSLLDIFVGGVVYLNTAFIFKIIIKYLAYFSISKGAWSILSSAGFGYYFDWMGAIDLVAGLSLVLINFNIIFGGIHFLAIVIVLKGLYSLILSA